MANVFYDFLQQDFYVLLADYWNKQLNRLAYFTVLEAWSDVLF